MNRRDLEQQNEQLSAQVAELTAKLNAALTVATKPVSKGKAQAEAAYALLQAGPVTMEQLAGINQKYPNDPIYFVRTILKVEVKTVRAKGGKTTYSLKGAEVVAPPAPEEKKEEVAPEAPAPTEQEAPAASEPVADEAVAQ